MECRVLIHTHTHSLSLSRTQRGRLDVTLTVERASIVTTHELRPRRPERSELGAGGVVKSGQSDEMGDEW